jgi:uncharacterized protein involved in response to NO
MRTVSNPLQREHALWQCALRPFFLAALTVALAVMAAWLLVLGVGLSALPAALHPRWHGLGLMLGMGLAAVAGFLFTAVPEFTSSAEFEEPLVRRAFALWLPCALLPWLPWPWAEPAAVLAGLVFLAWLSRQVLPRLWRQDGRPHLELMVGLIALELALLGLAIALWRGQIASTWLDALLLAFAALTILAASRISMRIVNRALDARRAEGLPVPEDPYLARPPRRRLALTLLVAQAAAGVLLPELPRVQGWLALASAAALAALMTDWHVGRALLRRWPLALYLVYVSIGAGCALWGLGQLGLGAGWVSGGRHLLAVGGFGLAIFMVMAIAGRTHVGVALDERPWLPAAVALLLAAAALRVAAALGGAWQALLAAGLCWMLAFAWMAAHSLPLWWCPRSDGQRGCQEPLEGEG